MNVFYDTEFTDLLSPELISIGFISASQRTLYLELRDWALTDCSHFVREAVLPLLDAPSRVSAVDAASTIAAWLESLGPSLTLLCDSPVDHELFTELLHFASIPMPPAIARANVFSPSKDGEQERERLYATTLRRHHALDDAKALLASWQATNG